MYSPGIIKFPNIAQDTSVRFLRLAPVTNRLLVVAHDTLILMKSDEWEGGVVDRFTKKQKLADFCVNENPITNDPFSIQV